MRMEGASGEWTMKQRGPRNSTGGTSGDSHKMDLEAQAKGILHRGMLDSPSGGLKILTGERRIFLRD